ncbi:MAG: hypothetical protein JOZ51_20850 [Chloroflexi bacterium]|nr:hypothetical protein [Chloroflexota bacterium]
MLRRFCVCLSLALSSILIATTATHAQTTEETMVYLPAATSLPSYANTVAVTSAVSYRAGRFYGVAGEFRNGLRHTIYKPNVLVVGYRTNNTPVEIFVAYWKLTSAIAPGEVGTFGVLFDEVRFGAISHFHVEFYWEDNADPEDELLPVRITSENIQNKGRDGIFSVIGLENPHPFPILANTSITFYDAAGNVLDAGTEYWLTIEPNNINSEAIHTLRPLSSYSSYSIRVVGSRAPEPPAAQKQPFVVDAYIHD